MKFIGSLRTQSLSDISYFINDAVIVSSWFEGFIYCKSLGMEIFSPQNRTVTEKVIKLLNEEKISSSFFIGGTTIGTSVFFYSVNSGKEIEVDSDKNDGRSGNQCLGLQKIKDKYEYAAMNCFGGSWNFICEAESRGD
jgi:hypothetical protein